MRRTHHRAPAIRVFTTDGVDERASVSELFEDEIIVDSFAGGGGASHGIEMAFGRGPDIAINHDAEAIALHKANHPNTEHYIENVWRVDPVVASRGRKVGLMWLSPDCKHFSKAKGGKPVSKKIRGLAWVAVRWAVAVRPRVIVLENVEEFQTWGPVLANGQPCPARKGRTFKAFVRKLEKLGYVVEWRELKASLYNTPTIRKRLFLIARCDGQPIIWPEEENGPRAGVPERAAAECIDWSLECPSIFDREERGQKPLAPNTMRRIARGIKRFVLDNPTPFIVSNMNNNVPKGVEEPLATITSGNKNYLAQPFIAGVGGRMGQSPEKSVDSPLNTITSKGDSAIVVPHITKFRANSVGHEVTEPMHTVTSNGHNTKRPGCAIPLGLASALLVPTAHQGDARCHEVTDPLRTICGKRGDVAVVTPHLINMAHGGSLEDLARPMTTIATEKGGCRAVVAPTLVQYHSAKRPGDDRIGAIDAPLNTQDTENRFAVAAPILVPRYGEDPDPSRRGGEGQAPRARSVDLPMPSVVPTGNGAGLVSAFMAQHNTGLVGHEMTEPVSTIVQKGCTQALVEASFVSKMYGTSTGAPVDEPMHTVVGGGSKLAQVSAFMVSFYGTDQNTGDVTNPIPTVTPRDRFGLITTTIDGNEYVIVDIGMRMLQPRELYRAQGFPDTYKIEVPFDYVVTRVVKKKLKNGKVKKVKVKKIVTKPLTKTAQVRMCGNSVCPPLARAILAANFARRERKEMAA